MTEPAAVPRHTNRLVRETSPYLLQHAHNPVDWHPWGEEALARARSEDRPIFLSIGYAACHWCHVMERESFEDEATARQLNGDFVPIKVDREERPEIDAIYMEALQSMTGQGGWPLNVFLTPAGRPFYGGTYFPDQPRHGLPSFRQVLDGVATAWRERRAEIERAGEELARSIAQPTAQPADAPAEWMLESAVLALERSFDARLGGWGRAPKFPQPMTIEFLLAQHVRTGDQRPLAMARRTLDAMAAGGIYDHLGGGFARYATDAGWLVPHFEKMLYDNALLARVYVHAWQLTGEPRFREVAEETLAFIGRDLADPDGGFAASLDADTDGEEGATYVWTQDEIDGLLGPDAAAFDAAYSVTADGNWEGRTILARAVGGTVDSALEDGLRRSRQRLAEARRLRPQPARDDKVLAAWNGLAIAAFADAGRALDAPGLIQTGARAAEFVLANMRDERGRLLRSYRSGAARHAGVLEDHAHFADGLLALYRATFDERWFGHAVELVELILANFADPGGGYFDTAADHEQLIARPKGLQDNALPSGNAMTVRVLVELAALTGEGHYRAAADAALRLVTPYVHRHPTAFAQWLVAMQLAIGPLDEVAVVGDRSASATTALLEVVQRPYRPAVVVAFADAAAAASSVPLLAGRALREGVPTAYVCHGFACRQPVTEPGDLVAQLSSPGV